MVYRNPEYYPDPTAGEGIWRAMRAKTAAKAERLKGAMSKILHKSSMQKAETQARCISEAVERIEALNLGFDLSGLRCEVERLIHAIAKGR